MGDAFEIKFRMFNHQHAMSLVEFCRDLRVKVFDYCGDGVEGYDMLAWWKRITDGLGISSQNHPKLDKSIMPH